MATRRKAAKSAKPKPASALTRAVKERDEALRFQAATADILASLGRSRESPQPVFDAIVQNVQRLFETRYAIVFLINGEQLELAAVHGDARFNAKETESGQRFIKAFPQPVDWTTFTGRAMKAGEVRQLVPIIDNPKATRRAVQLAKMFGYNSMAIAPLVLDGHVIGAIGTNHSEARRYSEHELAALKAFADQAVIAIENARLYNETKQALERQTATSDVLGIISRSPTDVQPVLDAVAEKAAQVCGAEDALIMRVHGDAMRRVAHFGPIPSVSKGRPVTLDTPTGRAISRAETIHIRDIRDEFACGNYLEAEPLHQAIPFRTLLCVPLLREGAAIGAITIRRLDVQPFGDHEIALLKTFADQAVIAIENVRLFNETKEALERQTATGEILASISNAINDTQPVFDAIVGCLQRLFDTRYALVSLIENGQCVVRAMSGKDTALAQFVAAAYPYPADDERMLASRAIKTSQVVQLCPIRGNPEAPESSAKIADKLGYDGILIAPLLRAGKVIGYILTTKVESTPFDDKQVALIKSFADQAVIAIENTRLFNETKEALEQQTAISEILRVISGSPSDVRPVLQAVAERAARICDAKDARLFVVEGDKLRFMEQVGDVPGAFALGETRPIDRSYVAGRCVFDRSVLHIEDIDAVADEFPTGQALGRALGIRTFLAVPLLREERVLGAILLRRAEVRPFSDKQIALLKTFADQAAIAIENVRLFNETNEALERQTATGEILASISNAINDAQPVFDAIVGCLHRLFDTRYALVALIENGQCVVKAMSGEDKALAQFVSAAYPYPADDERMLASRAVRTGRVVQLCPIRGNPEAPEFSAKIAEKLGYDGILVAPLMRAGTVIGYVLTTRIEPTPFDEKQVALIKSFADQAVIAIENARLFGELQSSNNNLSTALDQQTATSGILSVISRSTQDVQPVFDAIAQSAVRLLHGWSAVIWRMEGEELRPVAFSGGMPGSGDAVRTMLSTRAVREMSFVGKALREREPRQVLDSEAPGMPEILRATARMRGWRSNVAVPMLHAGSPIGMITLSRAEAGGFTEKEIELLKTFADQAVIAIENVRLFNETKEALERQTATAEVLRVISGSPTDVQPVFDAILESATKLCEAQTGILFRFEQGEYHALAIRIPDPGNAAPFRKPIRPSPDSMTGLGRIRRERRAVHIPDMMNDPAYDERDPVRMESLQAGMRSWLGVPMLKEGTLVGAIVIYRSEPRPFTEAQIALLQTFADQAVIAIENVRLFNETREALERQTATSEILKVISSSTTDTQPVFEAIVRSAAQLFPMSNATIFMRDGDLMRMHATEGATVDEAVRRELASIYPIPFNPEVSTSARAMVERQINICLDTEAPDVPEHIRRAGRAGRFRSNTVVPLVRDDEGIGTIVIAHPQPGYRLNDKQLGLLRTFADQAVIAIENTRLFNELEARNKDLAESLEQQTATSEVLKVISRTKFDLEPVLNIVMDNALNLCAADRVVILRANAEGAYVPVAGRTRDDAPKGFIDVLRANPIRPDSSSATGRAIIGRTVIHIPDVLNDPGYKLRDIARSGSYRTLLAVPMLREGVPIGVLALSRAGEPKPFTDKQVALVTTFADQAVIAIENVRLFNEIQEKTRELEVANRHKSEFLANMSHELRTPLNAIIGFSEVLIEKMFGEVNEKQLEYLNDIHESGKHLLSLINDILDLSKIEAGRMELELSRFDLPAAIGNALTLVRERAQRHGIRLAQEIDPRLGEVQADERKVKQILLNLLSNAVKFTPDGGRVEVSAKLGTDKVEIAVRDTGIGIAAADQAALFEEFRQVGRDGARKAEGTGLGLALTKKFAELHGGAIRVESAPGAGATFTVSLPLRSG